MQKKIDKEYLIKNRFWISIPIICLFLLIGFVCVIGVRSEAASNFDKAKAKNKELEDIKKDQELRNEQWLKRIREERDEATKQMIRVWKQEFDRQNNVVRDAEGRHIRDPLITWPKSVENIPVGKDRRPLKDHDYGEPVGTNSPFFNELPAEYEPAYRDQFDDIRRMLDLLDEKAGTGSVRVLGSRTNWENALELLKPTSLVPNRRVLSDEAWLLQEDVAIKRELAKAVVKANDLVAGLQPEWRLMTTLPEQLKSAKTGEEVAPGAAAPAPSAPISPSAASPAGDKSTDKTDDAKKEKRESVDRQHFLNTTWQFGLFDQHFDKDGNPQNDGPSTAWWEGWLLDLELLKGASEGSYFLEGLTANFGYKRKTPAMRLEVVLADEFTPKLHAVKLELPEMPPSAQQATQTIYDEQQKGSLDFKTIAATQISKQKLSLDLKGQLPDRFRPHKVVAVRRAVGGERAKPGDSMQVVDRERFTNDFWVFDIEMVKGPGLTRGLRGMLYNRSNLRLSPPSFIVLLKGEDFEYSQEIAVWGDKLNAVNSGGQADFHKDQRVFPKPGTPPLDIKRSLNYDHIVSVRQVLDWQTVPIKRIDRLELGSEAHHENDRVKIVRLRKYEFGRKSTLPTAADAAGPEEAGPGGPGPGMGGPGSGGAGGIAGGPGGMGRGGMGGQGPKEGATANHSVPQFRYYETESEVRRVPVALVMIVDANHIADVLTSFANTRMRVQVTEAVWTRLAQGLGRPNFPSESETAGKGSSGDSKKGAAPSVPVANKPIDDDTLQVELQIYGLATIYEDPDAFDRITKDKSATPGK